MPLYFNVYLLVQTLHRSQLYRVRLSRCTPLVFWMVSSDFRILAITKDSSNVRVSESWCYVRNSATQLQLALQLTSWDRLSHRVLYSLCNYSSRGIVLWIWRQSSHSSRRISYGSLWATKRIPSSPVIPLWINSILRRSLRAPLECYAVYTLWRLGRSHWTCQS